MVVETTLKAVEQIENSTEDIELAAGSTIINLDKFSNQELRSAVRRATADAIGTLAEFSEQSLKDYQKFLNNELTVLKFLNGIEITEQAYQKISKDERLLKIKDKHIESEIRDTPTLKNPDKMTTFVMYTHGTLNHTAKEYRFIQKVYKGDNKKELLEAYKVMEKAQKRLNNAVVQLAERDNQKNHIEHSKAIKDLENRMQAYNNLLPKELKQQFNEVKEAMEQFNLQQYKLQVQQIQQAQNIVKVALSQFKKEQAADDVKKITQKQANLQELYGKLMGV